MRKRDVSPPALAMWLLARSTPPDDRESVVGDFTEWFADRHDTHRRFNRVWFWMHACLFAAAAVAQPLRSALDWSSRRNLMERFTAGLRHAVRRLRYDWRYAAGVVLILAIGIGPAAAMWSVVDRVLLRPLDYNDPDRLVLVRTHMGQITNHPGLSPAEVQDLRAAGVFESVQAQTRLSEVSFGPPDHLVPFTQLAFTTGMLPMLGVTPALGRNFEDGDFPPPPGPPGTPALPRPPIRVLLDHDTWRAHFAGDSDVIRRLITINGQPAEVIGVLPSGFRLVTGRAVPQRIDVYTPFQLFDQRESWQYPTLARLKPGTTIATAQAGLDTVTASLLREHAKVYDSGLRWTIAPVLADLTRDAGPALRAAVVGVLLLLVVAFANATALVVARLRVRERDLAIRSAIGASRGSLVGEVLMESLVLGAGGAVVGGAIAAWAVVAMRGVIPQTVPRWDDIAVGWPLLAYAGALAFTGLVCLGLIPVWRVFRSGTWNALRIGSVQGGRAEGTASRLVLVGSQVALTVVLAFGCVQLVRSAIRLGSVELGFDPNVLTLRVPYDGRRYDSALKRAELFQQIRDRVGRVPGVEAVGVVTHLPLSGSTMVDGYQVDLAKATSFDQSANYQAIAPGYFASVRIPMLQGRDITDEENAQGRKVAVVDETLVRAVFPNEPSAIGRTLHLGWRIGPAEIVGVVGHAKTIEVGRAVRPQIYVPMSVLVRDAGIVTVRTAGDPLAMAGTIVAAIRELEPGRAISNIARLEDNVARATSTLRAMTGLVTAFAVLAGVLAAIGLYLVIAFVVHQRRRSTAIRAALGATREQVIWHHVRTGIGLLLVAVPVGLVLSFAIAPLFGPLVYGVGQRDVGSFVIAPLLAIATSALGMYFPVRRAARANVVTVLREG
jgi:putative ABC transport system permease protein